MRRPTITRRGLFDAFIVCLLLAYGGDRYYYRPSLRVVATSLHCPRCKGFGNVDIHRHEMPDLRETCPLCRGTGFSPFEDDIVPEELASEVRRDWSREKRLAALQAKRAAAQDDPPAIERAFRTASEFFATQADGVKINRPPYAR